MIFLYFVHYINNTIVVFQLCPVVQASLFFFFDGCFGTGMGGKDLVYIRLKDASLERTNSKGE